MPIKNPNCAHFHFHAEVEVARMERHEGSKISDYLAAVRIVCADCGRPFRFVDQRLGLSLAEPTASPDRLELRVPIEPARGHTRRVLAPGADLR
jgi:hypothetical protein